VVPPQDYPALFQAGASAIFGPGTVIGQAALRVLDLLEGAADSPRGDENR
jgi:methylmalonyl-CoA mutase